MSVRWGECAFVRTAAVVLQVLPALLLVSGILVKESRAEGLSGYLEFDYSKSDLKNTVASGQSIHTNSDSFTQLYSLTFDRKLYPNLNLLASGTFQNRDNSFVTEGLENDSTTTSRRPYVNLNLRTPLYFAEAAYSRNEEKVKTSGFSLTTVRESFISTLYWRPDRFPDLKLQYLWDHLYDKERLSVDTVTNSFQVTSNYVPVENLRFYYQGTIGNTDLRLTDTTAKETINNARVNYSNNWWERRISFGLDYNFTRRDIETTTTGAGEIGIRIFPSAGLSASSDTPENVILTSNPALIDGDLAAGSGINLGLPPSGGDTRRRNMGLDFLVATEINTMYVWVDRDVTQVAGAFSWGIYTSTDQQNWVLRQTIFPAIYSPTFNRFEIRFTNVNARYVKVVTVPLSPVIPFASGFPIIQVTELQAESRRPASEVAGKVTTTSQNGTMDFRAVLFDLINLTYEFSYIFAKRDPGDLVYTMSNGLSFFRQLNKVFSGRGRVAFENGEQQAGYRDAILYTVSVTAVPFQTLYHTLTFSGIDETIAGKRGTNVSILLFNNAKLYEGIDVNLGCGISFLEDDTGRKNRNTHLNMGATFVPNRKTIVNLYYNGTTTVSSGGGLAGETTDYTRSGEGNLTIIPLQSVYLYGSYRIETSSRSSNRNILNYSATWSPFPDGTLHFTFYYVETLQSDEVNERSVIPSLRWYFTPRSYLNLSYQSLKRESPALTTLNNIYSGTVRINF